MCPVLYQLSAFIQMLKFITVHTRLIQTIYIRSLTKQPRKYKVDTGISSMFYFQLLHAGLIALQNRTDKSLPMRGT